MGYDRGFERATDNASKSKIGKQFEWMMRDVISKAYPGKVIDTADDKEYDYRQGTDMVFDGVVMGTKIIGGTRMDPTLDFQGKDNVPFVVKETGIMLTKLHELQMGVRIANSHNDFGRPVVVFGTNMTGQEWNMYQDAIESNLRSQVKELVELAQDVIKDYTITIEQDRKAMLTREPLVPNKDYRQTHRVSKYFQQLNAAQKRNKRQEKVIQFDKSLTKEQRTAIWDYVKENGLDPEKLDLSEIDFSGYKPREIVEALDIMIKDVKEKDRDELVLAM